MGKPPFLAWRSLHADFLGLSVCARSSPAAHQGGLLRAGGNPYQVQQSARKSAALWCKQGRFSLSKPLLRFLSFLFNKIKNYQ